MVLILNSYQNLSLLQNLYKLRAIGFEYIDHFTLNEQIVHTKPRNIQELQKSILKCHLCDLSKSRSQAMGGFGSMDADLMIIDYTVSQIQDANNDYYIGRSGEILKNMVENVLNISIDEIYYTHTIKCKPFHTNKPSQSEWNSCKNHLYTQLEFIRPKVLVVLGEDAYTALVGDTNFEHVRGHIINFKNYKLIPIYHPQYLLRNPELKKITLNDLKTIKTCL